MAHRTPLQADGPAVTTRTSFPGPSACYKAGAAKAEHLRCWVEQIGHRFLAEDGKRNDAHVEVSPSCGTRGAGFTHRNVI